MAKNIKIILKQYFKADLPPSIYNIHDDIRWVAEDYDAMLVFRNDLEKQALARLQKEGFKSIDQVAIEDNFTYWGLYD